MRILVSGWESGDIMCGGRGALQLVYTCTICPRDKSSACIAAFVHPLLMDHLVDHCAVPKMELKRTAHSIKRQSESVQMFHVPQFHWHSAAVKRGRLSHQFEHDQIAHWAIGKVDHPLRPPLWL